VDSNRETGLGGGYGGSSGCGIESNLLFVGKSSNG